MGYRECRSGVSSCMPDTTTCPTRPRGSRLYSPESPVHLVPEIVRCLKLVMQQSWSELAGFSIPAEVKVGGPGDSWAELQTYQEKA